MRHAVRGTVSHFRATRPSMQREAFTLIEVLVVVSIIALLLAILLPSLKEARVQSRRTVCRSQIHQLMIGLGLYQADYKGKFPHYQLLPGEGATDGMALWINGVGPTRLGILFPKYVGKSGDVFYCPDASNNELISKAGDKYPWANYGKNIDWAYGSYEYRPRYFIPSNGQPQWVELDYTKHASQRSIVSDAFAGSWDSYGPYPVHTPIQGGINMLYYNVGYADGSARAVKDFAVKGTVAPFAQEFWTRAPGPAQGAAGKYTPLKPFNNSTIPDTSTPTNRAVREKILKTTNHIERGWWGFDRN